MDPYGDKWACNPTNNYMGIANITDRYPSPHGTTLFDMWKFNASKLLGGK